jgi:hypothetical protein
MLKLSQLLERIARMIDAQNYNFICSFLLGLNFVSRPEVRTYVRLIVKNVTLKRKLDLRERK